MPKRALVSSLPEPLRDELDRRLMESQFSHYDEQAAWLKGKGYKIGKSSIHRYASKLERKLATWRAPVTAVQRLDDVYKAQNTRIEQAKIRQATGMLVLVVDPATRETTVYATPHSPERTREIIEAALFVRAKKK